MKKNVDYASNVFINCPFDKDYDAIFNAILFTVYRCGFVLRCAKEYENSGQVRIQKVLKLIEESKYSIHDLSRVTLDGINNLPRFNMPLELGIVPGCQQFGNRLHKTKEYLVLDSDRFRFQKFISDIAGQDIRSHEDNDRKAVKAIRDWLVPKPDGNKQVPSYSHIFEEYQEFLTELPILCKEGKLKVDELTFQEFTTFVTTWLINRTETN